jgi:GNAT superfamily N-acetyltransferase
VRASDLVWRPLLRADVERLPEIDRSEVSEQRYEVRDGGLVVVDEHVERTRWTQAYYDVRLPRLYASVDADGVGWSVLAPSASGCDRLVAISVIDGRRMGAGLDMLDLTFIHVTRELRGSGVGGELFDRSVELVRERGAKRMYVSASDSRGTVDFYLRRGMTLAAPPDPRLHEIGPNDIHLELAL